MCMHGILQSRASYRPTTSFIVVIQDCKFFTLLCHSSMHVIHLLNAWFKGVLLPGKKLAFPFVFKSPNAGIFSEMWLIQTGPVLCRGRPILFTLKGVAFQDDLNKEKREELEVHVKCNGVHYVYCILSVYSIHTL